MGLVGGGGQEKGRCKGRRVCVRGVLERGVEGDGPGCCVRGEMKGQCVVEEISRGVRVVLGRGE